MVVTEAFKEVILLHGLVNDLRIVQEHVRVHCDSQSSICLVKNQVHHAHTKHIDVRFYFVQKFFMEGDMLLTDILKRLLLRSSFNTT